MGSDTLQHPHIRRRATLVYRRLHSVKFPDERRPACGSLAWDRSVYDVRDSYNPSGRYRYNRLSTNWQSPVAQCVDWIPLLPGLVGPL
jgi:hypothetical protein